jgi:ribosome-binding factor A
MPREFSRVERVEEAIHRAIAEVLLREVADPRIAHLTVSRVKVSRDLAYARVYVTGLADGGGGEDALRALRRAAGFLRSGVARRLLMRTVPELRFVRDTSLADGNRLAALIEEVSDAAPPEETGQGDG